MRDTLTAKKGLLEIKLISVGGEKKGIVIVDRNGLVCFAFNHHREKHNFKLNGVHKTSTVSTVSIVIIVKEGAVFCGKMEKKMNDYIFSYVLYIAAGHNKHVCMCVLYIMVSQV